MAGAVRVLVRGNGRIRQRHRAATAAALAGQFRQLRDRGHACLGVELRNTPREVNVHTTDFPDEAIRGQLGKWAPGAGSGAEEDED